MAFAILGYRAANAQTDSTSVKNNTITVKDPLVKNVSRPDSTPVKDTAAKTIFKQPPHVITDGEILNSSPVKTLTYKQYDALMKGEDLYNMALPATLNNYPMPDDVIRYHQKLDLSPAQFSQISAIAKELKRKRIEMGPIVIRNERMLDSLFRTHKIDDGTLIFYANRYGLYQGELRNAILQACYQTERLLSKEQVKLLAVLENHK